MIIHIKNKRESHWQNIKIINVFIYTSNTIYISICIDENLMNLIDKMSYFFRNYGRTKRTKILGYANLKWKPNQTDGSNLIDIVQGMLLFWI